MAPASRIDRPAPPPPPLTFARWFLGILRRRRLIAGIGVLVAGAFVAAALALPPVYRAEASFVSNTGTGLKLPAGISGMAGLAGMAAQAGMDLGSEPSESPAFYVQLMESRELLTRLLETRFADPRTAAPADSARLVEILKLGRSTTEARRLERGVKLLRREMALSFDTRTNLVKLEVELPWSELTAAVANRTVELVNEFNREQRTTRARSKRAFVEERLTEAEQEVRVAENRHRDFLAQNRQYGRSPTLAAEEQRLERRMIEAVDLASTLRREYETARIEEVNDAPVVTRVDSAVPPQRPQWPRPAPLAVLALTAGLVIGVLTAAVAALLADWAARNPDDAAELRRLLGRGRRRAEPLAPPGRAAADAVPIGAVAPPAVSGSATHGGSLDLG